LLRMNQPGIVHKKREHLVIPVLGVEGAALVELPQRARAALRVLHEERQLDERAARKAVAFSAAQAECDIDRAVAHLARLLAHLAEGRCAVEDGDLERTMRLFIDPRRPRLGDVALEEALRAEEVAELERDRLCGRARKRGERTERNDQQTHGYPPPF